MYSVTYLIKSLNNGFILIFIKNYKNNFELMIDFIKRITGWRDAFKSVFYLLNFSLNLKIAFDA